MLTDSEMTLEQLRVDGGAAANNFLMQFQADVLGINVERPAQIESTGLGATYLAGITAGVWNDIEELEANRTEQGKLQGSAFKARVFSPRIDAKQRNEKLAQWKKAVQRVMS